jgi:hypothetical protein
VPTRALASALLHGYFSVVKWLVTYVVVSQSILAVSSAQNVSARLRSPDVLGVALAVIKEKPFSSASWRAPKTSTHPDDTPATFVFVGLVERVPWVIGLGQQSRPSRPGLLEDQLDVVVLLLES